MKRVSFLFCFAAVVYAQGDMSRPAAVKYTRAIQKPVEQTVELPGHVEAPNASVLASEIGGLVIELKAREGDRVVAGQPLVMLRTTSLELALKAAQARLKEAQAKKKMSEKKLDRSRRLIEANTISQQALDESQYEFAAWEGNIENLRAEISGIEFDISRSVIRAPFNGVVVARHTEVGQWSDVGDSVLEILSTDTLEVHVDVPEKYFNALEAGSNVKISFDSLPERKYAAFIRAVVPRADLQAHTFPVKLRLMQTDENIGAGMMARAVFPLGQSAPGLLVPKDAIVRQGPMTLVYLMNSDDTALPVPVTPLAAMGMWSVVDGEIVPGARVITRGNERLQPGQPVHGESIQYPVP